MRLALVLMILPAVIHAEPSPEARARSHFEAGVGLYRVADYPGALKEFAAGYALAPKPGFLLNIAQTYRQLGNLQRARAAFQQFLAESSADDAHRREVKESLREIDEALRQVPPPEPTEVAPSPEPPAALVVAAPSAPSPPRGRRSLRIAGYALGAVGIVGLAGGLAAGLLANGAAGDLNALDQAHGVYDPSRYRSYQSERIGEGVSLGLGAAALVTGVVLYLVGRR